MRANIKHKINPKIKPYEKLRAAMVAKGYTQDMLRKVLGLSHSTFNLKINGKREFTISECKLIAQTLGTTLDEIFFSENCS